jgi:hypothetical protein
MRSVLLLSLFVLVCVSRSSAQEANICRIEEQQCRELIAYRTHVPALVSELDKLKTAFAAQSDASAQAYEAYLAKFYSQASEYRDIRISMYKWQNGTATWIFVGVSILTTIGLALAGYQLGAALSLGKAIKESKLEISSTKLVATTSSVGVIILLISFSFFLFSLKRFILSYPPAVAKLKRPTLGRIDTSSRSGLEGCRKQNALRYALNRARRSSW